MSFVSLISLAKKTEDRVNKITARGLPSHDSESDVDLLDGKITTAFETNQSFQQLTGYPRELISHWVDIMHPHSLNARKRGPLPKSSLSDALLCYLLYMHIDADQHELAKTLGLGIAHFTGNVERVRGILNTALREKWANLLPRPLDDPDRPIYEVGVLVDSTTVECFRPKGRFGEVKHYFDGHNCIYGLKIEGAVTSARPHVMVTASPHYPGSVSDYTIHKENYEVSANYAIKTAEERRLSELRDDNPNWATLGDKLYIGPSDDTPGERRITPKKKPMTQLDKDNNKLKGKARVPIEQYWGRMYLRNGIFNNVYRYDHSHFDMDFQNACLLTNEDIMISNLALEDGEFYQKMLDERVERFHSEEKKRKASQEKYKTNKKRKLERVQKYVKE
jgi:hypothetical protein